VTPAAPEVSRAARAEAFALVGALLLLLAWGCLFRPQGTDAPSFPDEDKWKHLAAHAVLAAAWVRALVRSEMRPAVAAALAVALGALAGGAIELIQPRFGRSCDLADEAANVIGALIGALAYARLLEVRPPALARLLAVAAAASLPLALAAGAAGCEAAGPRKVTVITVPGRSAGIEPDTAVQPQAFSETADTTTTASGSIPLAPDEDARLIEQAGLLRLSGPALARDFYAALEVRVRPEDRPFFRWLGARILPARGERRRALGAVLTFTVRLHGALLDVGDMDFEEGRAAAARAAWDEALALAPRSPRALARRALGEGGRPRAESAMAAARAFAAPRLDGADRAAERVPDPFVGRALAAVGRRAEAQALLARCEAEGFSPAIAARFRGDLALDAGDLDGASRAYERALVSAPAGLVPSAAYARVTLPRIARLCAEGKTLAAEEIAHAAAAREAPGAPPLFGYVSAALAYLCGDSEHAGERAKGARARDLPGAPLGRLLACALAGLGRADLGAALLAPERP